MAHEEHVTVIRENERFPVSVRETNRVTVFVPEVVTVGLDGSRTVIGGDPARVGVTMPGIAGPPGPPGPATGGIITRVAGTNLSGHRLVVPAADATVGYADNTNPAHLRLPVWLTTSAVVAGAPVDLLAEGEMTEPSWSWAPNSPLYLGIGGLMTQTVPVAPAFLLEVAVALSATTIHFDPQTPIRLA